MLNFVFTGGVRFRTTEHCGGQIEVNYRNKWEKVCLEDFSNQFLNKLCLELKCGPHDRQIKSTNNQNEVNLCIILHSV